MSRWLALRLYGRMTVVGVTMVRLWLATSLAVGIGVWHYMATEGYLYVTRQDVGVYLTAMGGKGVGVEWSDTRPLHVAAWVCDEDGWSWRCPVGLQGDLWARPVSGTTDERNGS